MALDERDQDEPAAGGLDLGAADDLLGAVIAALDQHVGADRLDQGQRGLVIEHGDGIDAFQRREQLGAVLLAS